jgi:hypothetical protein
MNIGTSDSDLASLPLEVEDVVFLSSPHLLHKRWSEVIPEDEIRKFFIKNTNP